MQHDSDTLAISMDQDSNIFLHRKDPKNPEITLQTIELKKFEAIILFETLLDIPDFEVLAIGYLNNKGMVRPNHDI